MLGPAAVLHPCCMHDDPCQPAPGASQNHNTSSWRCHGTHSHQQCCLQGAAEDLASSYKTADKADAPHVLAEMKVTMDKLKEAKQEAAAHAARQQPGTSSTYGSVVIEEVHEVQSELEAAAEAVQRLQDAARTRAARLPQRAQQARASFEAKRREMAELQVKQAREAGAAAQAQAQAAAAAAAAPQQAAAAQQASGAAAEDDGETRQALFSMLKAQGMASYKQGNLPDAEQHFGRCLELLPGDIACMNNLAMIKCMLHKHQEAIDLATAVMENVADPNNVAYIKALGRRATAGAASSSLSLMQQAREDYRQWHKLAPLQVEVLQELQELEARIKEMGSAASAASSSSSSRPAASPAASAPAAQPAAAGPARPGAPSAAGAASAARAAPQQAQVSAQQREDAEDYRVQGNAAFQQQLYAKACFLYAESIRCNPTSPLAYGNRAAALIRQEKFAEALVDAEQALQLQPGYGKALMRQAQALEGLRRHAEAYAAWEAAADNDESRATALVKLAELKPLAEAASAASSKPAAAEGTAAAPAQAAAAQQEQQEQEPEVVRHKIVIEETDGEDSSDDDDGSWTIVNSSTSTDVSYTASLASDHAKSASTSPTPPAGAAAPAAPKAPAAAAKPAAAVAAAASRAASALAHKVPELPKTAVDFQRALQGLASEPERQLEYFLKVRPGSYKQVFKASLEAPAFAQVAACLLRAVEADAGFALESMRALAQVPRFDMLAMQLGKGPKQALAQVIDKLQGAGEDVAALRKKYKL